MSLLAVLAAVRLLASASPQGAELGPLLRTRSFYFVPVSDPDGYAANAASAAGGNSLPLHRKNMRPTCPHAKAATGVDLNRNFPTCFEGDKHGASANPCAEVRTHSGPLVPRPHLTLVAGLPRPFRAFRAREPRPGRLRRLASPSPSHSALAPRLRVSACRPQPPLSPPHHCLPP